MRRRRRLWWCIGLALPMLVGCASFGEQQRSRAAALERWSASRARVKAQLASDELAAGRLESAGKELLEARRLAPDNADYAVLEARVLLAQGATGAAAQVLGELAVDSAGGAEAEYLRGVLAQQRLDWKAAAAHFAAAAAAAPDDVDYLVAQAQTLLQLGDVDAAAGVLAARAERFGWHDAYLAALAECREQEGDWDAAADAWGRLVDDDGAATVQRRRGLALMRAGRWSEACEAFAQCRAASDGAAQPELRVLEAECRWMSGDRRGAVRELETLLQRRPEDVETLRVLAMAVAEGGEHARAARLADRACGLAPDRPELLALTTALAYRAGMHDLARARALELSRTKRPDDLRLARRVLALTR